MRLEDRRRFERIRVRAEARLVQDGKEALLQARDLSLGGAFLAAGPTDGVNLAAGAALELTLLPDEDSPHHAVTDGAGSVHVRARVVRADATGYALAFVRLDPENRYRLRSLLEPGE